MTAPHIIALTGGIGSGKSTVSSVLRVMGYKVYDCDSEAKLLMDRDMMIKRNIADKITPTALNADGSLNRKEIAACVFTDAAKLECLNSIVHGAVANHFKECVSRWGVEPVFVETAILYQSGFDALADEVWEVTAPRELRVERVMCRNSCTRADVEARIASQDAFVPLRKHPQTYCIINDGNTPLLPQIERLLFKGE